jgi:hypothetical protein
VRQIHFIFIQTLSEFLGKASPFAAIFQKSKHGIRDLKIADLDISYSLPARKTLAR